MIAPKAKNSSPRTRRLALWKKLLFSLVAVCGFFGLLELLLSLLGVERTLYAPDPYVGFASNVPLFVEERGRDGHVSMVTAEGKLAWFNPQRFPREKPQNGYRIFCLGGSTTYGRPYTDVASFSGWLRAFLPAADPTRTWEVVNCGGISYASYRLALLMEELIDYSPDLFVVYTGHNEFLERRTYEGLIETPRALTEAGGWISRTRTWAVLSRLLPAPSTPSREDGSGSRPVVLGGEVDTVLEHTIGPSAYTRDDEYRDRVVAHFRYNLHRMIDMARSVGAGVLLVTPAANLRSCSPFKSEHATGLAEGDVKRFDELYRRAQASRDGGRPGEALSALAAAAAIDGRFAQLHYLRGLCLYDAGRYDEAREAFVRALEEDVCPLRAPGSILKAVRETANERRVPLIDFARDVEDRSEHGIPGSETFHDHVHLTVEGYRRLGLRIVELLERRGVVNAVPTWNEQVIARLTKDVEARIDTHAQGVALRNLAKVFSWAGKMDEAAKMAEEAQELLGDDAESQHVLGRSAEVRGDLEEAIRHYRRALELGPDLADTHLNLGRALRAKGDIAAAIGHYREALRINPDLLDARFNLALALRLNGDVEEAARELQRVVEGRADDAVAHYHLGEALGVLGQTAEAAAQYRRAIKSKPDYAAAHCNLGVLLNEQGRVEEAERHLRKALDIEPGFVQAHYNLGVLLQSSERPKEAEAHYRHVLEQDPDRAGAAYNLAVLLHTSRRLAEAANLYARVIEVEPGHADAHYNLGLILEAWGERDEAIRHYEEALRHAPRHEGARRRLAMARGQESRGQR